MNERPFCKECRFIYRRPVEEWAEDVRAWYFGGAAGSQPAIYGCEHTVARQISNGFVSCERMRVYGAPCQPEARLWEARETEFTE